MLKKIDNFLNSQTMYSLVRTGLTVLIVIAIGLAFLGKVPYRPLNLFFSIAVLLLVCWTFNRIFARLLKAAPGVESAQITAMILFFLVSPPETWKETGVLAVVGVLAMASKFVVSFYKRHFLNPAAFGVWLVGLMGLGGATWWVATPYLFPFVLVLGLLLVRKVRKFSMFFSFLIPAILVSVFFGVKSGGGGFLEVLGQVFLSFPLIFFGTVMLTEPYTTPPHRKQQVLYGVLAGILSSVPFSLKWFYTSPELALLLANLYSYAVSYKKRHHLAFFQKNEIGAGIYEFLFKTDNKIQFKPGQYMEWTLVHTKPDSRGNRRYFTIASAPEEEFLRLAVKVPPKASSFKNAILNINEKSVFAVGQLQGDFVMPKDSDKKLAWIAGGIGVTPFRSKVMHMLKQGERRDVVMFYTSTSPKEFVYQEVFKQAESLGLKPVYTITDAKNAPPDWQGIVGFLNAENIKVRMPDFLERTFYLSGPNVMVDAYKKLLRSMGVSVSNIVTDYFPGY